MTSSSASSREPTEGSSAGTAHDPARELRAEALVDAAPERVWELLSDLSRMSSWSPELVLMVALRPGGLRRGQWYLGVNRRKLAVWPTRNVVAALDPGRVLAWDTTSSGARWIWELVPEGDGTRVVHRRPVPQRLTVLSRLFAPLALGGSEQHADELEAAMQETVDRFRDACAAAKSADGEQRGISRGTGGSTG